MKRRVHFISLLTIGFFLLISNLMADDYYVDLSGTDDGSHGGGPGTNAWATLQYAIDNVANPGTATIVIHVSGETYSLSSTALDINRGFTDLTILGAGAKSTIIEAELAKDTATDRVIEITGSDETVALEALTIRYGYINDHGGGILNNGGTLTMTNCAIEDNGVLTTNVGGGIRIESGALTMENCTFLGNSAGENGGGLQQDIGTMTLTNCTFCENSASSGTNGGGAIYTYATSTITNCTFANNTATTNGGGIYLHSSGTLYIKNTLLGNNTGSSGADFYNSGGTVTNNGYNIVEVQNGADFVNGVNGCLTGNQANLNLSVLLEDNNTVNGTQTLKTTSGSVAIDAGEASIANNGVSIPTLDQRGASRNSTIDIGSYEYWADDGSLPVSLSLFKATQSNDAVILEWITESEVNNAGFILDKQIKGESIWTTVTSYETNEDLRGKGNSSSRTEYVYEDADVTAGITYRYRLSDVDLQGNITVDDVIEITVTLNAIPKLSSLEPAFPNPFNPSTKIRYNLAEDAWVTLRVVDMTGRTVNTIVRNAFQQAGSYILYWNGRNASNMMAASGTYLLLLKAGDRLMTQKVMLVK